MNDTNDTYLTIKQIASSEYREKGSKFLAFAIPVSSDIQLKEALNNIKAQYFDAHHHCYAYILGAKQERYRANDDGEPNHSAGDPILGQIRSKNLTDTLVVVVRYFGGTKLGVSGLITAYKTAAANALQEAEILEKIMTQTLHLQYNYSDTSPIMRLVEQYEATIISQKFDLFCNITLAIRKNLYEKARTQLSEWIID
jgi:uncharacterized YigZ family protein